MQPLLLENFLPYRLSVLTNRVSSALSSVYDERYDLTISEWRVMATLGRYSNLSPSAVCALTAMDKVQVSRAIKSLLAAGRLSRRADKSDGRRSLLKLSAKGRAIYQAIVPEAESFERDLRSALSENEWAAFDLLLAKLDQHTRTWLTPTPDP
jgi:DNA-binding MarR family transcriptional regulator